MVKNNVVVKERLDFVDKIGMTKELVSGYFYNGEYTPYYRDINDIVAFFRYCVDGLEFDENESIYETVTADEDLMRLYRTTVAPSFADKKYNLLRSELSSIYEDVADIVDFEKQRAIHSSNIITGKLVEILDKELRNKDAELNLMKETERLQKAQADQLEEANKISALMTPEEIAELNRLAIKNGDYDQAKMAEIIADKYFKSDEHTANLNAVIDEKNAKISELQQYKKVHDARNVLADNK